MSKLILEQEIFFFPTGSVVEPPGAYYLVWRPSLVHPLWIYQVYANGSYSPNFCLEEQNSRFGIWPLVSGTLCPQIQEKQMILQNAIVYNLRMGKNYSTTDYVEDPYLGLDSQGNNFYGHTFSGGTAATIYWNAQITGQISNTDTLVVTATNGTATITSSVTLTAGQTVVGGTLVITSLMQVDAVNFGTGGLAVGRPGIGFRIKYTSGTAGTFVVVLNSITFNSYFTGGNGNEIGLVPYDFPDMQQLVQKLTVYRPVSSSAWAAFEGSTLNDGGQHTCLMYSGGEHPNVCQIYNYSQISQVDGSYEDKINKGSYQFWTPVSTRDTQMREPVNSSEWTHPYMVIAGSVQTTTNNVNPLRLRGVSNMEFCSPSQLWSYGTNVPNKRAIDEATLVLRDVPTSMSNDSHLENIWNWLKGSAKKVKSFWDDNQGWIGPLAYGAKAAAGALMSI